jgi:chemotaxis protein methyltransferase CheR
MEKLILREEEFKGIAAIVEAKSGIHLTNQKRNLVFNRLRPRLRSLQLERFSDYLRLIREQPEELALALNLITTNVTRFFREEHHFRFLEEQVLPAVAPRGDIWRAWSAGCSTGEEAYSLAITCREGLDPKVRWRILATDINTHVLSVAQNGIYPRDAVAHLPRALISEYFDIDGETAKVKESLKKNIWFRYLNLIDPYLPLRSPLDVVFCRNVFIYFTRETQRDVLKTFHRLLKVGGHLFLGHAESIPADWQREQGWVHLGQGVYQKVEGKVSH